MALLSLPMHLLLMCRGQVREDPDLYGVIFMDRHMPVMVSAGIERKE